MKTSALRLLHQMLGGLLAYRLRLGANARALAVACGALLVLLSSGAAWAQAGAPFNCDVVFYQIRNTNATSMLFKFAQVSPTVTPTAVYSAIQARALNALGYNPVDNYMYALESVTQAPVLYRAGTLGYELVGTLVNSLPGGTPLGASFFPTAGVFDAAGRYYFAGQSGNDFAPQAIFRVDSLVPVGGVIAISHQYNLTSTVTTTAALNVGDFDFNGAGGPAGILLGASQGNFYKYTLNPSSSNPAQGTATYVPTAVSSVGGVGSAFYDAFAGRFYVFDNTASTFYEILDPLGTPSSSPIVVPVYNGTPAFPAPNSPTDGTSCPISGTRKADVSIQKSDGVVNVPANSVNSYNITVTNAGPYPANYSVVRDPAAPGLQKLSVTCSAPGGPPSAVCPAGLNTATFEAGVTILIFPPGTSLVFNVNALVLTGAGTSVTNTATVTPSIDFTDTNLSNNSATDVDNVVAPVVSVVSAPQQCPANTVQSAVNQVVNGDFLAAAPIGSQATTVGGLNTLGAANFVAPQSGLQAYPGISQNPFSGDAGRAVPGSTNWLLSKGKTGAANYAVWQQQIGGLVPGRVYQALFYASNATLPVSTSPTLPNLQMQVNQGVLAPITGAVFSPAASNNEAAGIDRWSLVQGTFTATVSTVTLTISNFGSAATTGDAAGIAQVTLRGCLPAADVGVTKTNNTTTLSSLSTTTYTIVLSNSSLVAASDTQVVDPPAANLSKSTITCVASAGSLCPTSLSILALEGPGLLVPFLPATTGKVTLTVVASVTGPPGSTATNLVYINPIGYFDANVSNNQAQDSDPIVGNANLTISKTDGTTTLVAGSTTSYTVTVSNLGPSAVDGALLKDPVRPGLLCTSVVCAAVVGATTCPLPGATTVALLQGSGIVLPSMTAPASLVFSVTCGVTATGQ